MAACPGSVSGKLRIADPSMSQSPLQPAPCAERLSAALDKAKQDLEAARHSARGGRASVYDSSYF